MSYKLKNITFTESEFILLKSALSSFEHLVNDEEVKILENIISKLNNFEFE